MTALGPGHPLGVARVAVPELHPGAVGGAARGVVQAAARLRVAQRLGPRLVRPLLRTGAVAVPELDLRAVRGAAGRDVEALAQRADRAVARQRPLLRAGPVAGPDLDL